MKKLLLAAALLCVTVNACAQAPVTGGDAVKETEAPPINPWVNSLKYDGSNNLIAVCVSPETAAVATSWTTAGATLTDITDAANTSTITFAAAHGLYKGARLTISSGVAGLAGNYSVVTVGSATTVTITTAGVADATYSTGITVTTRFPVESSSIWAIKRLQYDGSNNLTGVYWATNPGNSNSSAVDRGLACSNHANY